MGGVCDVGRFWRAAALGLFVAAGGCDARLGGPMVIEPTWVDRAALASRGMEGGGREAAASAGGAGAARYVGMGRGVREAGSGMMAGVEPAGIGYRE